MGVESVKLMWLDGFCLIFIFLADISGRGQIKDRKSVLLFWDKFLSLTLKTAKKSQRP